MISFTGPIKGNWPCGGRVKPGAGLGTSTYWVIMAADNAESDAQKIRDAVVEIVGESGYSKTTLEAVLDRADLDRATFDRHFSSLQDCVVETWQHIMDEFLPRSDAAFKRGDNWRESLRHQAWDLFRFVEEDVNRSRLLIELSFEEEQVQARRDLAMSLMVDYVHLGRFEGGGAASVPRATAEALVGAIWNGLAQNIKGDPDWDALRFGSPQILYLTMLAYLGEEAAAEELRRAPEDLARYERGEL